MKSPRKLHIVVDNFTLCGRSATGWGAPPWEGTCKTCVRTAESHGMVMVQPSCTDTDYSIGLEFDKYCNGDSQARASRKRLMILISGTIRSEAARFLGKVGAAWRRFFQEVGVAFRSL